jgi:hypothetical protein
MTKDQVQEYATRIRLGEPLYAVDEGPGRPLHYGFLGEPGVLVVICSFSLDGVWDHRPPNTPKYPDISGCRTVSALKLRPWRRLLHGRTGPIGPDS